MPDLYSDTRIRIHGAQQLPGQVRLPELEDVEPRRDGLFGSIGRAAADHPWLLTGMTGLGGVAAAVAGSGGILSRGLRGMAGALAGFAAGVALTSVAGRIAGTGRADSDAYVADAARPLEVAPGAPPERLRVLDWNVHALMGPAHDGARQDPAAIEHLVATVRRERPDVLVLQEVQRDSSLGEARDDLAVLAERLGATSAVLVPNGTRPNGTQKGQAVLTFGETRIQDARGLAHADPNGSGLLREIVGNVGWARDAGFPLPDVGPGFHPRTTTDVMLSTPAGRAVRLLDVHLSGTGGAATGGTPGNTTSQEQQLVPLAATLDAWDGPTLLAGDFNVRGGSRFQEFEARTLGAYGLRDTLTERGVDLGSEAARSFSSTDLRANLDRIYASEDVRVLDARVLHDATALAASDHAPVVADVEIGG